MELILQETFFGIFWKLSSVANQLTFLPANVKSTDLTAEQLLSLKMMRINGSLFAMNASIECATIAMAGACPIWIFPKS